MGLGEKAKTLLHSIDSLDADKGIAEKNVIVALKYEPHTESGAVAFQAKTWVVPKGRMWVITHAAVANSLRKARGRMNIIDSHSANAAWGVEGPEAYDLERYSDCLYYHTRPQYAHAGETIQIYEKMFQAGDSIYYSLRYYEVNL